MTPTSIDQRLDAHRARLHRQLARLYRDSPELGAQVEALLRARHAERPADLLALDAAREADPDWFVDPAMIGYSTYVDRFGGSVAGVGDHIDHLERLGVRYLHLLAVLRARAGESDGGFAIADYLAVEPALGTIDDLAALATRLRAARISLCVDLALNHTGDDHRWAQAARSGDPAYRDFYITLRSRAEVATHEADLLQVFPETAPGNFTYVADMDGWVWTTFYPYQWDLNWRNPQVFLAMLDNLLRLANHGVEAFRLDSIAFLWKEPGTDSRNRAQVHALLRALRAAIDIAAPGVLLKAEAIVPTAFVSPYFGGDDGHGFEAECHLVYNNSLMIAGWVGLVEGSAELPARIVAASGDLPPSANWLTYARCHDDIGWSAVLRDLPGDDGAARLTRAAAVLEGAGWGRGAPFQSGSGGLHGTNGMMASLAGLEAAGDDSAARDRAFARIRLLNALTLAAGGLATQYMGDELGMLNDWTYRDDPARAGEGRWLHRPDMDWAAIGSDPARRIGGDLDALRAARIAAGAAGAPNLVATADPAVLALRWSSDIMFLNFAGRGATAMFAGPWADRLSGSRGRDAVGLAPLAVVWATPA